MSLAVLMWFSQAMFLGLLSKLVVCCFSEQSTVIGPGNVSVSLIGWSEGLLWFLSADSAALCGAEGCQYKAASVVIEAMVLGLLSSCAVRDLEGSISPICMLINGH